MIFLRRSIPVAVVVVLLGLAALCALLAVDVHAWQKRFTRDDVRFHVVHWRQTLWSTPAILPFDPARTLLGLDDGLAYRHALQLFWVSEVGTSRAAHGSLAQTRVDAQEQLQSLADGAKTYTERSAAANLLGVMTISNPAAGNATQTQTFSQAASYFRQAILDDPRSYAPKLNLEMLLRLRVGDNSRFGKDSRGGYGSGGSHGNDAPGGGY